MSERRGGEVGLPNERLNREARLRRLGHEIFLGGIKCFLVELKISLILVQFIGESLEEKLNKFRRIRIIKRIYRDFLISN